MAAEQGFPPPGTKKNVVKDLSELGALMGVSKDGDETGGGGSGPRSRSTLPRAKKTQKRGPKKPKSHHKTEAGAVSSSESPETSSNEEAVNELKAVYSERWQKMFERVQSLADRANVTPEARAALDAYLAQERRLNDITERMNLAVSRDAGDLSDAERAAVVEEYTRLLQEEYIPAVEELETLSDAYMDHMVMHFEPRSPRYRDPVQEEPGLEVAPERTVITRKEWHDRLGALVRQAEAKRIAQKVKSQKGILEDKVKNAQDINVKLDAHDALQDYKASVKEKRASQEWEVRAQEARASREAKAAAFYEQFGMSDRREALSVAGQELFNEYRTWYGKSNPLTRKFGDEPAALKEARRKHAELSVELNRSLMNAVGGEDARTKAWARAYLIRDTQLGVEEIRIAARQENLNEKGKTAIGAVQNWVGKGINGTAGAAKLLLKGYSNVAGKPGNIAAWAWMKLRKVQGKEFSNAEAQMLTERFVRASRIITSATLGTIAFGGIGTMGVTASVVFRAARGGLGIWLGSMAGSKAGSLYWKGVEGRKGEARSQKRADISSEEEMLAAQEAFAKGSARALRKAGDTRSMIEQVSAFLAGGAVAAGSGALYSAEAAHISRPYIEQLESVKRAMADVEAASDRMEQAAQSMERGADQMQAAAARIAAANAEAAGEAADASAPEGAAEAAPPEGEVAGGSDAAPESTAPSEAPSQELRSATITANSGEGFNNLFVDLRAGIPQEGELSRGSSPVIQYLFANSATELSQAVRAIDELGRSAEMHGGDRVYLDAEQNLWFVREGGEPQMLLENDPSAENGVRVHQLSGLEMRSTGGGVAEQAAPTTAPATPEQAAPAPAPAQAPETTPEPAPQTPAPEVQPQPQPQPEVAPQEPSTPEPQPEPETRVEPQPQPPVETPPATAPEAPQPTPEPQPQPEQSSEAAIAAAAEAEAPRPFESSSAAINRAFESPVFENYRSNFDAWSLFATVPPEGSQEMALRGVLFDVMRESGLGARQGESLEQYLVRANQAIELARTTGEPVVQPAVYQMESGRFVHGGDLLARQLMAQEYVRLNPGQTVIIENPGGGAPYLQYPPAPTGINSVSGEPVTGFVPANVPESGPGAYTNRIF